MVHVISIERPARALLSRGTPSRVLRRRLRSALLLIALLPLTGCSDPTPEEYLARGQTELANGRVNAAVLEFKNALLGNPQLAEARLLLGELYHRRGEHLDAVKELERALDLGEDEERILPSLTASKLTLGRVQEVIGELEERAPLSPTLEVVLGDAYLRSGDTATAANLYEQALAREPQLASGFRGLGKLALLTGDYTKALETFGRATELDPDNLEGWAQRGESAIAAGAYDVAGESFTALRQLPGGQILGALGMARTQLLDGELDEALREAEALLARAPEFPAANYLKALALFQKGDMEAAEAAVQQVQAVAPEHPPSLYLNGAIQFQLGKKLVARDQLERYVAVDPENESVRKLLASMYAEDSDFEAVVDTLSARSGIARRTHSCWQSLVPAICSSAIKALP